MNHTAFKAGKVGIQVARLIMSGQVGEARAISSMHVGSPKRSWTVAEARAISGACKYARIHYHGCNVTLSEFM